MGGGAVASGGCCVYCFVFWEQKDSVPGLQRDPSKRSLTFAKGGGIEAWCAIGAKGEPGVLRVEG